LKRHIIGLLCASFCLSAVAAEGKWTAGYGQGNHEYFIDQKGLRLQIDCPTSEGSADDSSAVSLMTRNGTAVQAFTVQAGGHTFQGPVDTSSRVGENSFLALLEALRKTDAVVKSGNQTITFPKSNAAQVIPTGKKLACNLK
jgi:hypothetical protein